MKKIIITISLMICITTVFAQIRPLACSGSDAGMDTLVDRVNDGFDYLDSKTPVTPEQFGAIGDGITNDVVAIQSAIDYATTVNGYVYFSNKNYRINSAINCTNVDIFGSYGATLLTNLAVNMLIISSDTLKISNLILQANDITGTSGIIVSINKSKVIFDNVVIKKINNDPELLLINKSVVSGFLDTYSAKTTNNFLRIDSSYVNLLSNDIYGNIYVTGNSNVDWKINHHYLKRDSNILTYNTSKTKFKIGEVHLFSTDLTPIVNNPTSTYFRTYNKSYADLEILYGYGGFVVEDTSELFIHDSKVDGDCWSVTKGAGILRIKDCIFIEDVKDGAHIFETGEPFGTGGIYIDGGYYDFTGMRGYRTWGSLFEIDNGRLHANNATFVDSGHDTNSYKAILKCDGCEVFFKNCTFDFTESSLVNYFAQVYTDVVTGRDFNMKFVNCNLLGKLNLGIFNFSDPGSSTISDTLMLDNFRSSLTNDVVTGIANPSSFKITPYTYIYKDDAQNQAKFKRSIGDYNNNIIYTYLTNIPTGTTGDTIVITITTNQNVPQTPRSCPVIIPQMFVQLGIAYNLEGLYEVKFSSTNTSMSSAFSYFLKTNWSQGANSGNWVIPGTFAMTAISATQYKLYIPNNCLVASYCYLQAFNTENVKSIVITYQ